MIVDGGVAAAILQRAAQVILRLFQLVQSVINPAQAVEVGAVGRFLIHRFLDHLQRFVQTRVPVGQHVPQVIQSAATGGVHLQKFAELGFGLIVLLHPLEHRAAQEDGVFLFLGRRGQFLHLVDGLPHGGPVLRLLINLRKSDPDFAVALAVQ